MSATDIGMANSGMCTYRFCYLLNFQALGQSLVDSCAIFLYFWFLLLLSSSLYSLSSLFPSFFFLRFTHISHLCKSCFLQTTPPLCSACRESEKAHCCTLSCPLIFLSLPLRSYRSFTQFLLSVLPEAVTGKWWFTLAGLTTGEGCLPQEALLFGQERPDLWYSHQESTPTGNKAHDLRCLVHITASADCFTSSWRLVKCHLENNSTLAGGLWIALQ